MDRAPLAWPRRAVFALAVLALSGWDVAPAAAATDSRVYVVAQFTAQAGDAAKAAAVFRAHAEASRRDPGNLSFNVVQDRAAPERFTTLEVWRTEAAMTAHQGTAHYKAFHAGIEPLLAMPPEVRLNRLVR